MKRISGNRKLGRGLSLMLITVALTVALALSFTMAESTTPIDVASIVNTTTDASLVSSPFTQVINSVKGSVVGVNNYQTYTYNSRGFGMRESQQDSERLASTGSGVVVAPGYVLTNYHVVEGANKVTLSILDSEEELSGEVVGFDDSLDIAIVYSKDLKLPAVPLGDSDQLQVGEWAICIGNPLSEELVGTTTVGIVSGLDRKVGTTSVVDKYGLKTTVTNSMIQIDAAINNGNSGGGLFNVLGQLMGIPSIKYTGSYYSGATVEGIGMAIPVNSAKPLIEKVLSQQLTTSDGEQKTTDDTKESAQNADETHPRLGVSVSTINKTNNNAVYAGVLPAGAMIGEVEANSPAEAAGLQVNDIIVEVDGSVVSSTMELQAHLTDKKPGDVLKVKVYRVEGLDEAEYVSDIPTGEYVDFNVTLTTFK